MALRGLLTTLEMLEETLTGTQTDCASAGESADRITSGEGHADLGMHPGRFAEAWGDVGWGEDAGGSAGCVGDDERRFTDWTAGTRTYSCTRGD